MLRKRRESREREAGIKSGMKERVREREADRDRERCRDRRKVKENGEISVALQ